MTPFGGGPRIGDAMQSGICGSLENSAGMFREAALTTTSALDISQPYPPLIQTRMADAIRATDSPHMTMPSKTFSLRFSRPM